MLSSSFVRATLIELDGLYNAQGVTQSQQNYYAKLSLIELCGWIEEAVDEMARSYCNSKGVSVQGMVEIEKTLRRVYGFKYEQLRSILINIVGIPNLLAVENNLQRSGASYAVLESHLNALTLKRNSAAHKHITGVQVTFDAPSFILSELNQLEVALRDLELELGKL